MLVMSQDVWPDMQGSVLVVKENLINDHPSVVVKLMEVSQRATDWSNQHPEEAAEIVARQLQIAGDEVLPVEVSEVASGLEIAPGVLLRSMRRMEYTTSLDPEVVQDTIDYVAGLGYIKSRFNAAEILDMRFIKGERPQ